MGESVINRQTLLTKTIPFAIIGIAAFLVYIVLFVDVYEMVQLLWQIDFPFFLLAAAASILEMLFIALTWQFFLKSLTANTSFKKLFAYTYVSNFIDHMIPAESVMGEITKIMLLAGDGVKTGKVAASVITHRILSLCIVGGTVAVGIALMLIMRVVLHTVVQVLAYFIIAITTLLLIFTFFILTRERWALKIVNRFITFVDWVSQGRLRIKVLKERMEEAIDVFYQSLRLFREKPRSIIPPVGLAVISWIFGILINYFVFVSLGYKIDWIVIVVGYALIVGLKAIPVGIPAEVGVTEIAMTSVFGAFNVPLSISAASVILIRIITSLLRLTIGLVLFQIVGVKAIVKAGNQWFS